MFLGQGEFLGVTSPNALEGELIITSVTSIFGHLRDCPTPKFSGAQGIT